MGRGALTLGKALTTEATLESPTEHVWFSAVIDMPANLCLIHNTRAAVVERVEELVAEQATAAEVPAARAGRAALVAEARADQAARAGLEGARAQAAERR